MIFLIIPYGLLFYDWWLPVFFLLDADFVSLVQEFFCACVVQAGQLSYGHAMSVSDVVECVSVLDCV